MTDSDRTTTPMVKINRERMRRRRQVQGFSQTSLADAAKVHRTYVSLIESGKRPTIGPEVFGRICDALGIEDREELIDDGNDNDEAAA